MSSKLPDADGKGGVDLVILFTQQPVGTDIWTAIARCLGVAYTFAMATYRRTIS